MQTDTFWEIVESARSEVDGSAENADEVAAAVVNRLAALPVEEIIGFELIFEKLQGESYRWDLWAAAYLVNGGCSDDGFDYFRGWLVAQGRKAWEAALATPDSLAGILTADAPDHGVESEDMLGAASVAYERVTGDDEAFWTAVEAAGSASATGGEPAGDDFDFDDDEEMSRRLPRLAALFG